MLKQEFLNKLTEIGTCEKDEDRRNLIAELRENVGKDYDTITSLTQTNKTLTEDNESLRSANLKLFLRLGKENPNVNDDKPNNNEPNKKMSFDSLFDEKGEIK